MDDMEKLPTKMDTKKESKIIFKDNVKLKKKDGELNNPFSQGFEGIFTSASWCAEKPLEAR